MEEHVNGVRGKFYQSLIDDYVYPDESESFLYRFFWRDSVAGLLKMLDEVTLHEEKIFPELLEKLGERPGDEGRLVFHNLVHGLDPESEPWIKKQLEELMREHKQQLEELIREHQYLQNPEKLTGEQKRQARCLPLKKRDRWDFWRELWLNDVYCRAGLITDTEYYLWLAECLTVHEDYYTEKNVGVGDGHTWLYVLLLAGLKNTELDPCRVWGRELRGNDLGKKKDPENNPENNPDKVQAEKKLAELAGLIESARDKKEVVRNSGKARSARGLLRSLEHVSIHLNPRSAKTGSKYINVRNKAQVGRDLAALTRMMQDEEGRGEREIACRLQGLKYPDETREGSIEWVEYLPWLTAQLERMAIHTNIKTWLENSGYTIELKDEEEYEEEYEVKESPKGPRKQDFTMRLFEEYFDSREDWGLNGKDPETQEASGKLNWGSMGFCELEPNQHEALRKAMTESGKTYFYIPLAVDMRSGCVFFLAGSGNYEELYEHPKYQKEVEDQKAYREKKKKYNCCFDYLRLDEEALKRPESIADGKAFRLFPTFHLNAGRDPDKVLAEFKWYCMRGENGGKGVPRQAVKDFNLGVPKGIPDAFRWNFIEKKRKKEVQ